MSITRTYLDEIYISPQDYHVNLTLADNFRWAVCLPSSFYTNEETSGPSRILDFNFYQASRNGTSENITYINPIRMKDEKRNYFHLASDQQINTDNCYRIADAEQLQIHGSETSETEKYFGFII